MVFKMIHYYLTEDENGHLLYIIDPRLDYSINDILIENGALEVFGKSRSGKSIYFVFNHQLNHIKEILNKNETCEVENRSDFDLVVTMIKNY